MTKYFIGIGIVGLMVVAAILYGFTSSGSPAKVRAQQFDMERTSNLLSLTFQIENYYRDHGMLPTNLDQIGTSSMNYTDPETGKLYEYIPTAATTYQLCAVFSEASDTASQARMPYPAYPETDFTHGKGRACFTRTVKPLTMPPTSPYRTVPGVVTPSVEPLLETIVTPYPTPIIVE